MQHLSKLLVEFEQRLKQSEVTVSEFISATGQTPSEGSVLELIGVFAEYEFRHGRFDCLSEIGSEFPTISSVAINDVLQKAFSNYTSTYCPITDLLGELPVTHGDFLFIKETGRGGSGVVYEGKQQSLDRTVAIKVPFSSRHLPLREGRTLSRLDHPNIASVYHIGTIEHLQFIVMQYIYGDPLKSYCRLPPRWQPEQSVRMMIKVLDGIAACHQRGIAHLDLTPNNILISGDSPVIIDFGLATPFLNSGGHFGGTPHYIAPEILEHNSPDSPVQCDIFSLGVVLFELLTGAKPYGKDLASMQQPPRRCTDYQPEVDDELDRICRRAIAVAPENRYQTADEFQQSLKGWLEVRTGAAVSSPDDTIAETSTTLPIENSQHATLESINNLKTHGLVGFVILVCLITASIAIHSLFGTSSALTASPAMLKSHVSSRCKWMVSCFRENVVDDRISPMGLVQNPGTVVRVGDFASISAEIDPPAYCHLIAANPDGSIQFVHRTKDRVRQFSFPENGFYYKFNDGAGQQAFVLIAAQAPLDQWDSWRNNPPSEANWDGTFALEGIWQMDGLALTKLGAGVIERGDIVMKSVNEPLATFVDWLIDQTDGEVHSILFPVKN